MFQIERILCLVDFSKSSLTEYDYAQSLARHYQAKLFLQHVVDLVLPAYAYYAPAYYFDVALANDALQMLKHDRINGAAVLRVC
jgi:hypothetical protein